jgi:uncharacterized protein (DUF2141 family)
MGGRMTLKISRYFLVFTFLFFSVLGPSQGRGESKGNLTINISGFPSSDGFAMVALNNSAESYKVGEDAAIASTKTRVSDQQAQVVFTNLPYGWYGISIYHDENSNGTMDKNALGVPKEAYGFSNNARGFFGKPDYEDVKFELNSPEKQIVIKLELSCWG